MRGEGTAPADEHLALHRHSHLGRHCGTMNHHDRKFLGFDRAQPPVHATRRATSPANDKSLLDSTTTGGSLPKPRASTTAAAAVVAADTTPFSVALRTNDPTKIVRFTRHERLRATNEIRGGLTVTSGSFSCDRPFTVGDANLAVAIQRLREMCDGRATNCVLRGRWNDDFVRLQTNDKGQVFVTGKLSDASDDEVQQFCFAFRTGPEVLKPFADGLSQLL